jgi:D-beta-D-heptose 7-phosphate kinase/D-beta-D-heptose 1-phosphate adenosyltransferase
MDRPEADSIVSRFSQLKILVLGDFMLDQFIWGRVERISPEAPVPVVNVERESFSLGGAGNVVMNARALGAHVIPMGVIGLDWIGEKVSELLGGQSVSSAYLLKSSRPTTLKTRIVAHQQQVVRVDREERSQIDSSMRAELAAQFLLLVDQVDGVIVSDYSKGTITPELLKQILPEAKRRKKLVCLDPKTRDFSSYSPVSVITPNQSEAGSILGYTIFTQADLEEAGRRIREMIDCEALLITRGDKGMALFAEGRMTLVPTRAREVYDVTGAGDTVIAVLTLALAAGASMIDAVHLANHAAGIVVGKVGTASVTPSELLSSL